MRTDDGTFAFVHQSIMEWLVADTAAQDLLHSGRCEELGTRKMSQLMIDFLCDLAGHQTAQSWATAVLADPQASAAAKQNAFAVSTRITDIGGHQQTPSARDLAGVDLRGQNLTGRDLRGADLRGANLSGMRLNDVDFSGADLRQADLTGARLVGGSLAGALLDGSRWGRAALLGVAGTDSAAVSVELCQAADPSQDDVVWQVAPGGTPGCVAFSPDGALLAIARGPAVEIVDRADDRTVRVLTGHTGPVSGVAFSPDGALLATASYDRTARLWDARTSECIGVLVSLADDGYAVLLPDGSYKFIRPEGARSSCPSGRHPGRCARPLRALLLRHGQPHLGLAVGDELSGEVDGDCVQRAREVEWRAVVRADG